MTERLTQIPAKQLGLGHLYKMVAVLGKVVASQTGPGGAELLVAGQLLRITSTPGPDQPVYVLLGPAEQPVELVTPGTEPVGVWDAPAPERGTIGLVP